MFSTLFSASLVLCSTSLQFSIIQYRTVRDRTRHNKLLTVEERREEKRREEKRREEKSTGQDRTGQNVMSGCLIAVLYCVMTLIYGCYAMLCCVLCFFLCTA